MQFRAQHYRFRQGWFATLILLCCVPVFIKLGLWQYHKAEARQQIELAYTKNGDVLHLPEHGEVNYDDWRYKKVVVTGVYDTQYQILLDNQVENNQAGYHVLTPLRLHGREDYVLVNRGWVKAERTRDKLPQVTTPSEKLEIHGQLWIPGKKIFTLESEAEKAKWNVVWQHVDMARYQQQVPIKLLPFLIRLDPASDSGGFVRHWQIPPSKIATNLGYAYQWFGFAVASVLIYLVTGFRKTT